MKVQPNQFLSWRIVRIKKPERSLRSWRWSIVRNKVVSSSGFLILGYHQRNLFFESLIFLKKSGTQKNDVFPMLRISSKAMHSDIRERSVRSMSNLMDQKACFLEQFAYLSIFGDFKNRVFWVPDLFKKIGGSKNDVFFAMFQILSKAMYTDVRKPFVRYMSTLMDQKACFLGRVTYLSIFGDLQKLCFSSLWCSSIFIVFNHVHFADLLRRRGGSRCTCWRSVARLHGSQLAWMSADQAGPWNCAA